jgi:hypothetical protein
MTIRPGSIADRQACLDILDGNTPESFVREDLALLFARIWRCRTALGQRSIV